MTDDFDTQVARIAALGEPLRRRLYRYVIAQQHPVGREQAAAGTGVAHHIAKFHLDKLVTDGLLDVEHARPPGRAGPGAGRPAKLYRRVTGDISLSLPERHYDLAGHIMAEAITTTTRQAVPLTEALRRAARSTGHTLGHRNPRTAHHPGDCLPAVTEALADNGYEPRTTTDRITLANCPFHRLAQTHTQLVCALNLDLIEGLLNALCPHSPQAHLDPGPDRCCVTISAGHP